MLLFLAMLIGVPLLMMIVGMYRMLAWARVVKTWHKSIGSVVGYYMRTGYYGKPIRISPDQLPAFEAVHRRQRRRGQENIHHFAAIIQYQYGARIYELVQDVQNDETLPYAPGEQLLIYVHPANPQQTKVGDNINQLWHPFLLFMIGIIAAAGIMAWLLTH